MEEQNVDSTPSAYSYPLLIKHLLHAPFSHAVDQQIVYGNTVRLTYADLRERIARLASGLHKLGVRPGCTVAVMDWDSHRYLECYFAIPMMGCVLQTINVRLSHTEIAYTLKHTEAEILIVHTDFLPIIDAIKAELKDVREFIWISDNIDAYSHTIPFTSEYEEMLRASHAEYAFPEFDENTRATTFHTTGTTGLPKGVFFTHRQLVLHTITLMAALASPQSGQRVHRGDVYMPLTPMFHVHAWGMPYIATALGVKQVYPGRYVPERLVRLIADEDVTFSHCVPTVLRMVLGCAEAKKANFSEWKVIVGGGPLPQGLARDALARDIDVFAGYGMSETCPVLSLAQLPTSAAPTDLDDEIQMRCKAGLPVPFVELRIVDEEMNDVPRDGKSSGEIVARAPWLTQGYLKNAEASAQLWNGGYLHTQDIANVDTRGYVQIVDRLKDVIKSGGEWISSPELESLISLHPAVAEVAVIGVSDAKWGERPVALVIANPAAEVPPTEEDIRSFVLSFAEKGAISKYAVPQVVKFVDALPKTSVGKLDKRRLRAHFN
jgi:fatty-acyl-CoA synthase